MSSPSNTPKIGGSWIPAKALVGGLPLQRPGELRLQAGQATEVGPGDRATATDAVLWVEISSGSVMFDDMSTPTFTRRRLLFPVTADSWIRPLSVEFGPLALTPTATVDALADRELWDGLDVFHQVLCESEFLNKDLAVVDEYVRLQQKKSTRGRRASVARSDQSWH